MSEKIKLFFQNSQKADGTNVPKNIFVNPKTQSLSKSSKSEHIYCQKVIAGTITLIPLCTPFIGDATDKPH